MVLARYLLVTEALAEVTVFSQAAKTGESTRIKESFSILLNLLYYYPKDNSLKID